MSNLLCNDPNEMRVGDVYITAYKHVSPLIPIGHNHFTTDKKQPKFKDHIYVVILYVNACSQAGFAPVAYVMTHAGPCWLMVANLIRYSSFDQFDQAEEAKAIKQV